MKRFFRGGLISLFILLFLFGSITIQTVLQTQTNGRLINYVGIVRGASQRLIKLELSGQPGDDMIAYLDSILLELQGGEATYGLPSPDDPAYQRDLAKLELMWGQVKDEISDYRQRFLLQFEQPELLSEMPFDIGTVSHSDKFPRFQ